MAARELDPFDDACEPAPKGMAPEPLPSCGNAWLDSYVEALSGPRRRFGEWEPRPIDEVVREHGVELIETGNDMRFKAVCPFHDDHDPSMYVNLETQRFKCWACGCHGDAIEFVQRFRQCGFQEALLFATVEVSGPDALMRRMTREFLQEQQITVVERHAVLDRMRLLRRMQGDEAALMLYTRFVLCQTKTEVQSLLGSIQFAP